MLAKLRPWHWIVVALTGACVLILLWFGIAYGGLPRLWSHHEHKRIGRRDEIVSYTAQDIPADPINLRIEGDRAQIACLFRRGGWVLADDVSVRSAIRIAASVVLDRAYPGAPVSSLYVHDRVQDLAYQLAAGKSADRRHHVRLWRVAPGQWLAAATYDRGVGISLFTLQITHHIGADVDAERNRVGALVTANGGKPTGETPSRVPPNRWHRNGGGDRYRTDGMIKAYTLPAACAVPAGG